MIVQPVMIVLASVPLVVGALGASLARPVASRLAPAAATRLLTGLALSVALATGMLLCLGAVVTLAEVPAISVLGHWSGLALRASIPIPPVVGAAGGVLAAILLCSAGDQAVRVLGRVRRATTSAAALHPTAGDLVVVNSDTAMAYAIAGRHQRVVVSTGMLRKLSAAQRRALLAHEAAHLRHHHQIYVQLARLAASANPLMRPVSRAVDFAVERWADETAAHEVGDRATVAHALAVAAMAVAGAPPVEAGALAGAQTDVVDRIGVLLRPSSSRHRVVVAAVTMGLAACWLATALVIGDVHQLMELAQTVGAR